MSRNTPSTGRETPLSVVACLETAEALASAGRVVEARETFRTAIAGDTGFAARNAYGCFLMRLDRYAEARQEFTRMLEAADQDGDDHLRAVASNNLAAVSRQCGDRTRAAQMQQQSLAAVNRRLVRGCSAEELVCDFSNRANDAILAGQYGLAEDLFHRALWWEIDRGNLEGQAADWGSLGIVATLQGEPLSAVGRLWRAYRLHRRFQDEWAMGCDLFNMASPLQALGRLGGAKRCLERAMRYFRRTQARELLKRARSHWRELNRIAMEDSDSP